MLNFPQISGASISFDFTALGLDWTRTFPCNQEAKIKAGQNRPTWVQQMSLLTDVLPEDEQYKLA